MKKGSLPSLTVAMARTVVHFKRGSVRPPEVEGAELPPLLRSLRQLQSDRLAVTYADLLESPEFSAAARFFLTDLYAPRDFSRRDAELLALYDFLRPLLPAQALAAMANLIRLNDLTNHLDAEVLAQLESMGVTESFDVEQYELAYATGDYAERVRQIELVDTLLREVAWLHHLPFLGPTLRAAGGTARRLGWGELHDFLERGYAAWKGVRDAGPFLEAVATRERAILDRIFGL